MSNNSMRNIILEKIVSAFLKVMLLFSIYLLVRGHNNPGGGFIAAIIASSGFTFYAIIFGTASVEKMLKLSTQQWSGIGLLLVFIAAILPLFFSPEVLTGLWIPDSFPVIGFLHLGTPLLFDTGVFIVVTGVILTIILSIMEVLKWN
jgi:multicomponent Na+:H+ antiporter subunit B